MRPGSEDFPLFAGGDKLALPMAAPGGRLAPPKAAPEPVDDRGVVGTEPDFEDAAPPTAAPPPFAFDPAFADDLPPPGSRGAGAGIATNNAKARETHVRARGDLDDVREMAADAEQ